MGTCPISILLQWNMKIRNGDCTTFVPAWWRAIQNIRNIDEKGLARCPAFLAEPRIRGKGAIVNEL